MTKQYLWLAALAYKKMMVLLRICVFVFGVTQVLGNPLKKCKTKVDIGFVYEVPTSRAAKEFAYFRDTVSILNMNRTAEDCEQISFVVANKKVEVVQPLQCAGTCRDKSIQKLNEINATLSNKPSSSNIERVHEALSTIKQQIFAANAGGRSDAMKTIVLMVTTPRKNYEKLTHIIDDLEDKGYVVIIVGIGVSMNNDYLLTISHGKRNRILKLRDLREISPEKSAYKIISDIIKDPYYDRHQTLAEAVRPKLGCEIVADIAFLIDSSNSIKLEYLNELQFVQFTTASFGLSEEGTHVGVVVFSDKSSYSTLQTKFNEFYDVKSFSEEVELLPFYGYRTRIDLAFKIANEELFTKAGGERPEVPKIVFLITDGVQNPTREGGVDLDPVKASQPLIDRGIKIFVIGIGSVEENINFEELVKISRNPSQVKIVKTTADLKSNFFVRQIANETCKLIAPTTTPATTCITTPEPVCSGVSKCSTCCKPQQIFFNIFQAGSGPHYLMQGVPIGENQTLKAFKMISLPELETNLNLTNVKDGDLRNPDAILNLIQSKLNAQSELLNTIKKIVYQKQRQRRSAEGNKPLTPILHIAEVAGCNHFLSDLEYFGLVDLLVDSKKSSTLFCPTDAAYEQFIKDNSMSDTQLKKILLYHFARRIGSTKLVYSSYLDDEKLVMQPYMINGQAQFTINNATVKLTISTSHSRICIIDSIMVPPVESVMDLLNSIKDVSTFSKLIRSSNLNTLLTNARNKDKICFGNGICVDLIGDLKSFFQDLIQAKQFTFQILTDDVFAKMEKSKLNRLKTNKKARDNFLLQHIFLGILQHKNNHSRLIASSAMENHPVSELSWSNGKQVVSKSEESVYVVDRTFKVKEGLVQILKPLKD